MKRIVAALLIVTVLVGAAGVWFWHKSRGKWAPAFGGSNLSVQLPDGVRYLQHDPRWTNESLGKLNRETLGQAGCTVTSVAMAMTNLGHPIDPGQLNAALAADNGFTQQRWLMWDAISRVSKGALRADVHDAPSLDRLDACLARGDYPIVKFLIAGVIPHWVQIVGKDDGTYYMRDPSLDVPDAMPLTHRTPIILSVRCIGKAQTAATAQ